jgi:hypothetical protein
LQIYDPSLESWLDYDTTLTATGGTYADPSDTHDWLVLFEGTLQTYSDATPDDFTVRVATAAKSSYDDVAKQPTVFNLRMKFEDTNSLSSQSTAYDEFELEIRYECDDDVVAYLSGKSDIAMYVYSTSNEGAKTFDANYGPTIASCPMLYKFEAYDFDLSSWTDISTDGQTYTAFPWRNAASIFLDGAVTVDYADAANDYNPFKDFNIRITYTSEFSKKPEADRVKVEEFVLRFTKDSTCFYDKLAKNAELPDWTYFVKKTAADESVWPDFANSVTGCTITEKMYFFDDATNAWVEYVEGNASSIASYPFVAHFGDSNGSNTHKGELALSFDRSTAYTSEW